MSGLRCAATMLIVSRAIVLKIEIITLSVDLTIQRAIQTQDMNVPRWFIVTQLWLNANFMLLVYVAGLASLVALSLRDRLGSNPHSWAW